MNTDMAGALHIASKADKEKAIAIATQLALRRFELVELMGGASVATMMTALAFFITDTLTAIPARGRDMMESDLPDLVRFVTMFKDDMTENLDAKKDKPK